MKVKSVYLLAHKSRNQFDKWELSYYIDNPKGREGVLEYWHSADINEAKRFDSREELASFLLENPQLFNGAILLDYSVEYLERIKDDIKIKSNIRTLEGY